MRKKLKLNGNTFVEVFTEKKIASMVAKLAHLIKSDYEHDSAPLLLISVMNGAMYFGVDLSRALYEIGMKPIEETIRVSRYAGDNELRSKLKFAAKPILSLEGCNVIVIEDIREQGKTLQFIDRYLKTKKCKSIQYCVLLGKDGYPPIGFPIKYLGKDNLPQGWLTGYGMDSWHKYRGLKSIWMKLN